MRTAARLTLLLLISVAAIGSATAVSGPESFRIHFGHFATGGGYATVFTFLNSGTTGATGSLQLRDASGRPHTPIQVSVPPRGTNTLVMRQSGQAVASGWGIYEGTGGQVTGVATFQLWESGAIKTVAGVLASSPTTSASTPVEIDSAERVFTGYAVANPGTSAVTLRLEAFNSEGVPLGTSSTLSVPAGGQLARFVHQDLPIENYFQGSILLTSVSGDPFVAVALSQVKEFLSAVPVVAASAAP
jgi:hypothetical protein